MTGLNLQTVSDVSPRPSSQTGPQNQTRSAVSLFLGIKMKLKISKNLAIDAIEYASQGNAILGIRDSGKSYTATYLAERLLDAKIPFIAFDPIGVWRYLKIGKNGKGYQVVVAGDDGDLPLRPETAPNIVRAAMQENIPLVLDLYSMQLSKADWKKIVEQSVRLLLYENKPCGLRHLFIEEAAEFIPQRVRPDEGRVYAEMEKLARMGGNASLGYTLINQRAEEVNKAILELCDCLFLHRQKGRHSLTALGKWLDIADATGAKEVIKTLPSLDQGECWVWLQGSHEPVRIKVNEKKTVHPDRRNPLKITKDVAVDVSPFVRRMKASLDKQATKKKVAAKIDLPEIEIPELEEYHSLELTKRINEENADLRIENERLKSELNQERDKRQKTESKLAAVKILLAPQYEQMQKVFSEISVNGNISESVNADDYDFWLNKFGGKKKIMLELFISKKPRWTKQSLKIATGLGIRSVEIYLNQFANAGLVKREGDEYVLQRP